MIPIPKPGRDSSNPSNYLPKGLTSCLCKTMDRMANKRLFWFLESNKLITNSQCGFRKRRSTIDHVVKLETPLRMAKFQKQHLIAVFFDLEKAYNITWRFGIMKDLHRMGLRGRLPNFIKIFYRTGNSELDQPLLITTSRKRESDKEVFCQWHCSI